MPITVANPIKEMSTTGSFINMLKKFITYSNVVSIVSTTMVILTNKRDKLCDVDQTLNLKKISPNKKVIRTDGLMKK